MLSLSAKSCRTGTTWSSSQALCVNHTARTSPAARPGPLRRYGNLPFIFKKDLVRQARQPLAPALLVQPLAPAPQQLVLLGQLTDSPAASAVLEGTAKGLGLSGRHQVLPRLPYSPRTRTAPAPKAARSQNANASTRLSAAAPAVVPLQHALHATRPCRVKPWQLA